MLVVSREVRPVLPVAAVSLIAAEPPISPQTAAIPHMTADEGLVQCSELSG